MPSARDTKWKRHNSWAQTTYNLILDNKLNTMWKNCAKVNIRCDKKHTDKLSAPDYVDDGGEFDSWKSNLKEWGKNGLPKS